MNTGFYKDLETNFSCALEMSERDFTHEELLELLKEGNIPQRQIAAMKLDYISDNSEANILIGNLTGCDGKIREAVALRINQFLNSDKTYIKIFSKYPETFADGTIDINGNICRLVVDSAAILKSDKEFSDKYIAKILVFIQEAFEGLDKIVFRDKKYTVNKLLFKLYWSLEGLKVFEDSIKDEVLLNILSRASKEKEYTIREKAAQILVLRNNSIFNELKTSLINDDNYYVRNVFNY